VDPDIHIYTHTLTHTHIHTQTHTHSIYDYIPAGREAMPNLAESSENAKIPSGLSMSRRYIYMQRERERGGERVRRREIDTYRRGGRRCRALQTEAKTRRFQEAFR